MKRIIILLIISLLVPSLAYAGLKVVATLPWIGSLAKEIAKDRIEITTLIKPNQDPHYAEPKPSMILAARKADIIMFNGLDLEIGYLPRIIESSNNPKIQPGQKGYFDCSKFITPIEKPITLDRSMGDVHPLGNPHYHFSPENVFKVAEGMASLLSDIDPDNATFYQKNLQVFKERLEEKKRQWSSLALKGKRYISYHKLFEYMAEEFGFQIIAYIEPKPGIPPSAGHIDKLVDIIKDKKPDAILITAVAGKKEADSIRQRTGVRVIVLPHDVGVEKGIEDWFSMIDEALTRLHKGNN